MDRTRFFAALRSRTSGLFGTSLSQAQVATLEIILDEAQAKGLPLRHLAYVLATTYHEVGSALQPISENLNYSSTSRIRAVWPSRFPTDASAKPYVRNPQRLANKVYASRMGNGPEASGDGWRYRGRGYCQVTGETNYAKFGNLLGIDLLGNPDRAMEPRIAAKIMIEGMTRGLFTGKKMSDYLDGDAPDYRAARAIINGDVAANGAKIAKHSEAFAQALRDAAYIGQAPKTITIPKEPGKVVVPEKPAEPVVIEKPVVVDPEDMDKPMRKSKTVWTYVTMILGAPLAAFGNLDWRVQIALVVVMICLAIYGIKRRHDIAKVYRDLKEAL